MPSSEDKSANTPPYSHPPAPQDPFVRFSQTWPRAEKENENPFIQFRRFADEQFQSFFSAMPKMFGDTSHGTEDIQARMDEMMKNVESMQRSVHADEEDFRERLRAKRDARKISQRMRKTQPAAETNDLTTDAMQPWWLRGDASKCPALQEKTESAKRCPAMYDEAGNPRTELEAYETPPSPSKRGTILPDVLRFGNGLGWDGKQKQKQDENQEEDRPRATTADPQVAQNYIPGPSPLSNMKLWDALNTKDKADSPWSWNYGNAAAANPFVDHTATVPWLVASAYSPVFLANPAMGKPSWVHVNHQEGKPFQMTTSGHRFPEPTELDTEMAKLPWADAFEDLISLEQTGKMVDRDDTTQRTPPTWIHDCVSRGSFGQNWGFTEDGMLTKRAIPAVESKTPDQASRYGPERRQADFVRVREENAAVNHQATTALLDQSEEEINKVFENAMKLTVDLLGSMSIPVSAEDQEKAAKVFRAAVTPFFADEHDQPQEVAEEVRRLVAEAYSPDEAPTISDEKEVVSTASDNLAVETKHGQPTSDAPVSVTWSSNSSAPSSSLTENDKIDSIVSTMTRTETRTLPDGSVETTRVLRRRFADGREEKEETVDVEDFPSHAQRVPQDPRQLPRKFPSPLSTDRASQTAPSTTDKHNKHKEEIREQRGGWFWK